MTINKIHCINFQPSLTHQLPKDSCVGDCWISCRVHFSNFKNENFVWRIHLCQQILHVPLSAIPQGKTCEYFFRKYLLRDQMLSLCPPNGFWWLSNFIRTSSRKKRISVDGITNACMSFAILWNHDIDFQYGRQHSICRDTPMDGWWKIHQKELYNPVPLENKIKNLQTSHSSHLNFPFGALPKKT